MILVCGTDGFVETVAGPIQRVKLPDGKKRPVGPRGGIKPRSTGLLLAFSVELVKLYELGAGKSKDLWLATLHSASPNS